jgi:general secretion pathway protein J
MNAKGFTLIEILVAIFLASLIVILVFSGLSTSLSMNEKTLNRSNLLSQITLTDKTIKRDLLHALDRKARDERGDELDSPLFGETLLNEGIFLAFSIHTPIKDNSQGALKWVEYSKEGTQIIRSEYSYADKVLDSLKHTSILLESVDSLDLKFFNQGSFTEVWPPQETVEFSELPQMIEISFKFKLYGDIFRRYLLTK